MVNNRKNDIQIKTIGRPLVPFSKQFQELLRCWLAMNLQRGLCSTEAGTHLGKSSISAIGLTGFSDIDRDNPLLFIKYFHTLSHFAVALSSIGNTWLAPYLRPAFVQMSPFLVTLVPSLHLALPWYTFPPWPSSPTDLLYILCTKYKLPGGGDLCYFHCCIPKP